ncbi:MAG: hypothetical protein ACI9TY_001098 [Alphaproteobacteria bacterium]|jgi:hypothetical protein
MHFINKFFALFCASKKEGAIEKSARRISEQQKAYENLTNEPDLEKQKNIAVKQAERSKRSIELSIGTVCGFITLGRYVLKKEDGTLNIICHRCVFKMLKDKQTDTQNLIDLISSNKKCQVSKNGVLNISSTPYNYPKPACDIKCNCK